MDEYKLSTITQAQYDEIEKLVKQAKGCSSAKEAESFIKQIRSCANCLPNRCMIKALDIASCLKEYCKRNADKSRQLGHLNNALGVLESMIEMETAK